MDDQSKALLESIVSLLGQFKQTVGAYLDEDGMKSRGFRGSELFFVGALKSLQVSASTLEVDIKALETDAPKGAGFAIIQSVRSVDAQMAYVERALLSAAASSASSGSQGMQNIIQNTVASFLGNLRSIFSALSAQVWQLISRIFTVKEWSIKGTVTTPAIVNFLGASVSVDLSVTFEP